MEPISSVSSGPIGGASSIGKASPAENGTQFSDIFLNRVNQTNEQLVKSDETIKEFAKGNIDNPHEVMIQLEEAHLALQYTIQMRNKVVEAYQELMRMQL